MPEIAAEAETGPADEVIEEEGSRTSLSTADVRSAMPRLRHQEGSGQARTERGRASLLCRSVKSGQIQGDALSLEAQDGRRELLERDIFVVGVV